ncbi:unnamed protein product [Pleuronectes platessa]|uniref:Uncharacterized protein n=1 Tax=Pleuronectes platessa TaxID=8262 RepID=A0A9N7TMR1_PLEPL|nr:unnamed protein product [Pleuronectes platessa]
MSFSVFTALLWLFASASCAPTAGHGQDACAEVRNSSLELNRLAKAFSLQALNKPREEIDFYNLPVWMEAKDMCDPATLKHNSAPCMEKIIRVLTSYSAAVKTVAGIQSCKEFLERSDASDSETAQRPEHMWEVEGREGLHEGVPPR